MAYNREQVAQSEDVVFGSSLDEMMEYYRGVQQTLVELGFDEIEEVRTEHWENLPFKQRIKAQKWKDPYTMIEIKIKARVKTPRADRRDSTQDFKGIFFISSYVERTKYPHWQYFEEQRWFKRSSIYQFFAGLLDSFLLAKEWAKYKEEAQELAVEVASRIREMEGSVPAIGRSKREWVQPDFRKRR